MQIRAMRHGRRRVLAASAILAGLGLLTACSGTTAGGSDKQQTLTVWHYFSAPVQAKVMDDLAATFEKAHPDVSVKNVYVPQNELIQKLTAGVAAKSGPDVLVFDGGTSSTVALAGALTPITDEWKSFPDKGQFPDSVVHSVKGDVYTVQGYVNLLGLWYNADLLKQVGVEPPTTPDAFDAALQKVVAAGHQGLTLSAEPGGDFNAMPWMSTAGFDYADPQADALAAAFDKVRAWTDSGALSKEASTWDLTEPFQAFTAGDVGFSVNGNWQLGTAKKDAKFDYGVLPLPLGSKGKVYLGGEAEGIGAFAKDPKLAWQYLTETFWSADGEITSLKETGTIPARADAATDPALTQDPISSAFAKSIADNGWTYPDPSVPLEKSGDVQVEVGQVWSALVGGQSTPKDLAGGLAAKLKEILG
ncbi:sugar ABC transporter substrate-binding protein [Naasia aerilata]|uniref:Sugar ABC transporter substrate-binding protein n=1 Tax=Naasia aerilata TaxID=1162966 RepID=A0ABN6XRG6_9MICO|nr:extracellular solute-binding protein [Naasia aerilata]BDZ47466.1 sugar ABC transporter substrate-binding protein [Naasia aerilata]